MQHWTCLACDTEQPIDEPCPKCGEDDVPILDLEIDEPPFELDSADFHYHDPLKQEGLTGYPEDWAGLR